MKSRVLKILFIVVVIVGVVYIGFTIYGNLRPANSANQVKLPEASKAKYEIYVNNTGRILLSDDVSKVGTSVRMVGFWEQSGQEFVYRNRQYIIDEKVFGPITITLRK